MTVQNFVKDLVEIRMEEENEEDQKNIKTPPIFGGGWRCEFCEEDFKIFQLWAVHQQKIHWTQKHRQKLTVYWLLPKNLKSSALTHTPSDRKEEVKEKIKNKHKDNHKKIVKNAIFSCEHCPRKFRYFARFKAHLTMAHNLKSVVNLSRRNKKKSKKAMQQPQAPQVLGPSSLSRASAHEHVTKKEDNLYVCNFCGKTTKHLRPMSIHIGTHTGEKPFQCSLCKIPFSSRANCERHLRIHTGEKPYQCPECPSKFSDPTTIKNHMKRAHSNSKIVSTKFIKNNYSSTSPKNCSKQKQSKKFPPHDQAGTADRKSSMGRRDKIASKQNEVNQTKIPDDVRPHQCVLCGKSYAWPQDLKRHLIHVHPAVK